MNTINKDHIPNPQEVKGIFADTYNLYLNYKNRNVFALEDEVNMYCNKIEMKYQSCQCAADITSAVLKVLIAYGRKERNEDTRSL